MFDEVVLRVELGCKVLAGHLVVGRFGRNQADSVVVISQTLDKLIVHDPSISGGRLGDISGNSNSNNEESTQVSGSASVAANSPTITSSSSVYYVSVRDVIKTVSVKSFASPVPLTPEATSRLDLDDAGRGGEHKLSPGEKGTSEQQSSTLSLANSSGGQANRPLPPKDLLLIGCSNSVLIYDTFNRTSLLSVSTPTSINTIASDANNDSQLGGAQYTVCAGPQRLYTVRFESQCFKGKTAATATATSSVGTSVHAEVSSERSTGDTINCLAVGRLGAMELVLTGSLEQKIRVYQLDSFEQNIQTSCLTLDESAKINCLCPVRTTAAAATTTSQQQEAAHLRTTEQSSSLLLPSVTGDQFAALLETSAGEQMNYFAYGLESGFIGVYRLFQSQNSSHGDGATLSAERLWRQKCKHTPATMLMYDINGDGLDELVVGFRSSRLEARSPFTGQLLAVTRCFKSTERLAGLAALDYQSDGRLVLIACSTAGSLVGFKPRVSRPRIPLQGYAGLMFAGDWPTVGLYSSLQQQQQAVAAHANATAQAQLKAIEEEQPHSLAGRSDVFIKADTIGSSDLHIESQADDTKPTKCDVRQSLDLLQRISSLQAEQMELERRACHIYHMNVSQASKFYPSDVVIAHKWSFDANAICLRLSIIVSTCTENVKLIEIEDESRNFLSNGRFLVNPADDSADQSGGASNTATGRAYPKSHVIVVPLRSNKNLEARLELKVFCESFKREPDSNSPIRVARVYGKQINVPRFAMFTVAPTVGGTKKIATSKLIRMAFQLSDSSKVQLLEWLHESFLCFQFRRLVAHEDTASEFGAKLTNRGLASRQQRQQQLSAAMTMMMMMMDDKNDHFELSLVDIRRTLAKITVHDATNLVSVTATVNGSGVSLAGGQDNSNEAAEAGCKLARFSSTLRIAYSSTGALTIECESPDLAVELAQSLALIDRLRSANTSNATLEATDKIELASAEVGPILEELDTLTRNSRQLEESAKRIQTELYEAADYTRNLMQQLGIANELNEFTTAKELLNELFIMLNGAQNAARAHCLTSRSRAEVLKRISEVRDKVSFLTNLHSDCWGANKRG